MSYNIDFVPDHILRGAIAGGSTLLMLVIGKWILTRILKRLALKTETKWDDLIVDAIHSINWVTLIGISTLTGWKAVAKVPALVSHVVIIIVFVQIAIIVGLVIDFFFRQRIGAQKNQNQKNILDLLSLAVKFAAYIAVFLAGMDNLGIDVTALIAGLGIGGIAIALAVQSTLTDLLSSLSIILDRPFEVGDSFEVAGLTGTVEKIGMKTTRVRSVTGEEIVFPNSALLQGQIRNFRRMDERRVSFTIGVTYETSQDKLRSIPTLIEKIVSAHQEVRFDRAHFSNMGAYSLDFEVVYWVLSREFRVYRDVHQGILYDLFEAFAQQGIDFAYPTSLQYTLVKAPAQAQLS